MMPNVLRWKMIERFGNTAASFMRGQAKIADALPDVLSAENGGTSPPRSRGY
jgi:hypothetical protein